MFDNTYYSNRKAKLNTKQSQAIQKLNNAAFDYVNTLTDLGEQMKDLELREAESQKASKVADKKDKK